MTTLLSALRECRLRRLMLTLSAAAVLVGMGWWLANMATAATVAADPASASYQQGAADRDTWEAWFTSLTGPQRDGADYWTGQRSQRTPVPCSAKATLGDEWLYGCTLAKLLLAPVDIKRKTDPQYWNGWNRIAVNGNDLTPPVSTIGPKPLPALIEPPPPPAPPPPPPLSESKPPNFDADNVLTPKETAWSLLVGFLIISIITYYSTKAIIGRFLTHRAAGRTSTNLLSFRWQQAMIISLIFVIWTPMAVLIEIIGVDMRHDSRIEAVIAKKAAATLAEQSRIAAATIAERNRIDNDATACKRLATEQLLNGDDSAIAWEVVNTVMNRITNRKIYGNEILIEVAGAKPHAPAANCWMVTEIRCRNSGAQMVLLSDVKGGRSRQTCEGRP